MAHIYQYVWMPEGIARVEALAAHHCPGGPLFIQPVEMGKKLFQGQVQGFSWSMSFHLWLPSINFGACGICYMDQSLSSFFSFQRQCSLPLEHIPALT